MSRDKDTKVTFTAKEDEILIEIVSRYPFLYNVSLPDYRNSSKRDKVWEEIARTLNKGGEIKDIARDCKNRWKNIKDTYFRQKRKNRSGVSHNYHPKSKFEHYRRLLTFLESVPHEAAPTDTVPDDDNPRSPSRPSDEISPGSSGMVVSVHPTDGMGARSDIAYPDNTTESQHGQEEASGVSPSSSSKRGSRGLRKKQEDPGRYMRNKDTCKYKLLRSYLTTGIKPEPEDEIDLFTRQANSVLKKLPTYFQIKAMHELFEVLTKYKMLAVECPSGIIHPAASSYVPESNSDTTPFYMMDQTTTEGSEDVSGVALPEVALGDEFSSPVVDPPDTQDDSADSSQ